MTHIVTFHHPLRDAAQIHISAPHLHNTGGQGLVINLIITSTASMTIRTRFGPTAQTQKPTLFVPSAWTHMHTMFTHVMHLKHGTAIIQQWPKEPKVTFTYEGMTCPSVWSGKDLKNASVPRQHQTCLLGMQYCHSQSSQLSSHTGHLPLTIQMSGNTHYERWNSHRGI